MQTTRNDKPEPNPAAPDAAAIFARLVDARRRGDTSEGTRLLRELRGLGYSIALVEPKRPGGRH